LIFQAWNRLVNAQIDKNVLIDELLCSSLTEECYFQDCTICRSQFPSRFLQSHFRGDEDDETHWTCWKRTDNRVALQEVTGSVSLLLDDIDEQWGNFLAHHYCTKIQQSYIAEIKKVGQLVISRKVLI
jgi:hypothetical protein